MKISYIEPITKEKKRVERIFGCSFTNYPLPNIYILIILGLLEKEYDCGYNQDFLYFENNEDLKKFLDNDRSDIYLMFSVNLSMETDISFAKRILRINPNKKIIFLGPAPTYYTDKFLINENTYVVRGEPDFTVLSLIEMLNAKRPVRTRTSKKTSKKSLKSIAGISYIENKPFGTAQGKRIHNPGRDIIENLDALPFPARHFIKKDVFYNPKLGKRPWTAMLTSRGCSHRCIYCVPCALSFARQLEFGKKNKNFVKPPVRLRSPKNIIEEFKLLKERGYKAVSIIDDQFVWGKERTIEICNGIKDLGIVWGCLSRADHLDEETVKAMAQSGCKYVDIGVESFVPKILTYTKKDESPEKLKWGIRLLKKYGIFVKLNILFGASPLETKQTINETFNAVKEVDADQVMFDVCSPFPGTEFYDIAKKENWILGGDYSPIDVARSANINYPHLSNKELQKIVHDANLKFFLSPKFIVKNIWRLKKPSAIWDGVKGTFKKLFQ